LGRELDVDTTVLEDAASAQLWEQQYREALLLSSAEMLAWARTSGPLRHIQIVLEMQRLALDKFGGMTGDDVRTAEEARRLAHTSFEMERILLGQATNIVHTTDEDLDERIRWLQERLQQHEDTIEGRKVPALTK